MDSDKDGKWKKICPGLCREADLPKTKKSLTPKSKLTALWVSNGDVYFTSVSLLAVTWMQGEKELLLYLTHIYRITELQKDSQAVTAMYRPILIHLFSMFLKISLKEQRFHSL